MSTNSFLSRPCLPSTPLWDEIPSDLQDDYVEMLRRSLNALPESATIGVSRSLWEALHSLAPQEMERVAGRNLGLASARISESDIDN